LKRRIPAYVLCLLLICSVFIPISLGGNVKNIPYQQVSINRGNTLYVGGSGGDNYTKIQDAIDNASEGDFIFVYDDSSPYNESIIIDKVVNLIGEFRNTTLINGKVELNCDSAIIQRFKISDLVTINGNNTSVVNNIIDAGICIIVANGNNNNYIIDNIIIAIDRGIELLNSDNNFIRNNTILKHYLGGIFLSGCNANCISHNSIKNSMEVHYSFGDIHLENCKENLIISNSLICINENSRFGITMNNCRDNWIFHNTIEGYSNNQVSTIILDKCLRTTVEANIITDCFRAIRLVESWLNRIASNEFRNNEIGIELSWLSLRNYIIKNNFIDNGISADFYMISILNKWDENFWDEPRTKPFPIRGSLLLLFIPWIEYDYNPAQEPYYIGV
jgi:parallel beta-helix repeat protein